VQVEDALGDLFGSAGEAHAAGLAVAGAAHGLPDGVAVGERACDERELGVADVELGGVADEAVTWSPRLSAWEHTQGELAIQVGVCRRVRQSAASADTAVAGSSTKISI
jgi:hypothetical protein